MLRAKYADIISDSKFQIRPDEGCIRWSRGRNSLMKDAAEANAIIRLGRSVLIEVQKMDDFYSAKAGK